MNNRIKEIRERLERATPGPWGIGWCSEIDERAEIVTQFKGKHPEPTLFVLGEIAERKNQALIANAPADLAWLTASLREALECLEEYAAQTDYYARPEEAQETLASIAEKAGE